LVGPPDGRSSLFCSPLFQKARPGTRIFNPNITLVNLLIKLWRSSIGKKWLVALTGLALLGFVVAHLLGNLQMFAGADKINAYAEFLKANDKPLWMARIGLIACFVTHIIATLSLVQMNRAARPEAYALKRSVQAKLSTRTMALSGLTVLSFVAFHLAHYTLRITDDRFKPIAEGGKLTSPHDVYHMVIMGFQNPLISGFYVLSVGLLSLHLSHGISSVFQTLGLETKKSAHWMPKAATAIALLLFAGYASIPAAVLGGLLK
jgi:succinate dehydrogenase / fumarate reductase cytochrome b subunit